MFFGPIDRKKDLNVLHQVYVFWGARKNKMETHGLWLAETFLTSSLKPLNRIQRNLTGSKISKSSTKFVFFQADWKNKIATLASDCLDIFDFSSETETTEQNSTKLDRKQDLNFLYQVCIFLCRSVNKNGRPGWFLKRLHIVLMCTICGPLGLLLDILVILWSIL